MTDQEVKALILAALATVGVLVIAYVIYRLDNKER